MFWYSCSCVLPSCCSGMESGDSLLPKRNERLGYKKAVASVLVIAFLFLLTHCRYDFNYTWHQSSFHPGNIPKGNIQSNDTLCLWVLGIHVIWSIFLCFSISCRYYVFPYNGETFRKNKRNERKTKGKGQSTCRCLIPCSIWEVFDYLGRNTCEFVCV